MLDGFRGPAGLIEPRFVFAAHKVQQEPCSWPCLSDGVVR